MAIEGPFGTSSTDVFDYETVVCCGAGKGNKFFLFYFDLHIISKEVHFTDLCVALFEFIYLEYFFTFIP